MRIESKLQPIFLRSDSASAWLIILPVVALVVDLFTPILIWKGILPAYARWISHAAIATIIVLAYARMMVFDRVPGVVWVIAGVSVFGITMALFNGQSIAATAWGWWIMFQYPLVGLFAYLQPYWPKRFPQRLRTFCTVILGMEVVVQIVQYLTGQPPGDNLAGTFGWIGHLDLVIFIVFVLCLALGQWLALGLWKTLILVLGMGILSSVLGEMKLFPFAAFALGMLALAIFSFRRGQLWKLLPYAVLLVGLVWAFVGSYNRIVPSAGKPSLEWYFEPQTLTDYLIVSEPAPAVSIYDGTQYEYYYIGRNYALAYGWNAIRRDPLTLLFGWGLGARSYASGLGITGIGLLRGHLGLSAGTSLLVMMQELGLMGILALAGFILLIVVALFKGIKDNPQSEASELRYALLLFSLLWPIWLWYETVWVFRVAMVLYWTALGYVLGEPHRHHVGAQQPHRDNPSFECGKETE